MTVEFQCSTISLFDAAVDLNPHQIEAGIVLCQFWAERLRLKRSLKQDVGGPWWFRTVSGTMPDERRALVIWRKLTGNPEEDNLVLDEWFTKQGYSSKDSELDLILMFETEGL